MRIVIDIEADAKEPEKVTQVWCIVCKDIDTGELHVYHPYRSLDEAESFRVFAGKINLWVGHNILGYDLPVLSKLVGISFNVNQCVDTLILSRLTDYPRSSHSLESYGEEFGLLKIEVQDQTFFSKPEGRLEAVWLKELEDYCVRDVEITLLLWKHFASYLADGTQRDAIRLEHAFQMVCNDLHDNGFGFNVTTAKSLLEKMEVEISKLDEDIKKFPDKFSPDRVITPKATRFGTINQINIPKILRPKISEMTIDAPFTYGHWIKFNPDSLKQTIDMLWSAGWKPIDKTKGNLRNKDVDKDNRYDIYGWKVNETNLNTLSAKAPPAAKTLAKRIMYEARRRTLTEWINLVCLKIRIESASIVELGHAINVNLTQRGVLKNKPIIDKDIESEILISLENLYCKSSDITNKKSVNVGITYEIPIILLSKSLIKWLKIKKVNAYYANENEDCLLITITAAEKSEGCSALDAMQLLDGLKINGLKYSIISERIKGRFQGIGAWTQRMAHQAPNMANIPNEKDISGNIKLLGGEMRSLFCAPKNRLLVGTDAKGIQLRIFAHYINDREFTDAVVNGDPHTLNKNVMGNVCKTRAAAKRFIFAMLLGAGLGKLAEILECSRQQAGTALANIMERYTGFRLLKDTIIPDDAIRGYFIGLDGRKVRIPGDTESKRRHLCMSGYLQNGEAVVMKKATLKWLSQLNSDTELTRLKERYYPSSSIFQLVNLVHDEWQTECINNMDVALKIGESQHQALVQVGEELNLKCPLAGSYWSDDRKEYTIATNWRLTH